MISRSSARLLPALLIVLLTLGLGIACKDSSSSETELPTAPLSVTNRDGDTAKLTVEIADEPDETEKGLMKRKSLGKDAGMLFVLEDADQGPGFWMKDTSIPLSLAYISDCGQIVTLVDMEPFVESIYRATAPYRFGLEVNQGWFAKHKIAVGDTVTLPPLVKRPGCP